MVIDTARDASDTEAIFVDGVFTGRPPLSLVNTTSPEISHRLYFGNGVNTPNTTFIDFSLAQYKVATRNSFDLLLSDLLVGSNKSAIDVLKNNTLSVVTGDDSGVYQAYLVIRGRSFGWQGHSIPGEGPQWWCRCRGQSAWPDWYRSRFGWQHFHSRTGGRTDRSCYLRWEEI
ncbi:MAG: hypothetical protein H7249_09810 [Chitinophagaceae bacterium]|nr:hypothetical protein [Oligoflexus sp.]